jgi:predicted enzyme related to lactoylglutathione lyase
MAVRGIDATYYTVADLGVQTKFYTELLGTAPEMEWPERLAEWTFADGNSFGLYHSEETEGGSGGTVMFAVDDVAKAVGDAKARGVKFHEDGEVTDTPGCHMAFGEDPEGNQFILHHRKP